MARTNWWGRDSPGRDVLGKFAEAKRDVTKLHPAPPNDEPGRGHFCALANGLATRNWKGDSEKLVATGMAKEKAGSPDKAKIDAAFQSEGPDIFFRKIEVRPITG